MSQWTQERRQEQSRNIRRWKPWTRSTGAKTVEGKEISKMNAYKHGARSASVRELWRELRDYDRAIDNLSH